MINLIKAEWFKLKRDKNILIITIIIVVAGIITLVSNTNSTGKLLYSGEMKTMVALTACALYAGISIGTDFTRRTIQRNVMAGHNRITILISRLISYLFVCALFSLLTAIIFGGVYSLFYGWGEEFTNDELIYVIKSTILSILFNLCNASIMFFISFLIKDTGVSTAVSICIMILLMITTQNSDGYVADFLGGGIYYMETNVIYQAILLALSKIMGSIALSCYCFKRSELK